MIGALVRILIGGLLAVLAAGLVFELLAVWETGADLDWDKLVDTIVDCATWAWPFEAVAAFLAEAMRLRSMLVHIAGGMLVALAGAVASQHGLVPEVSEALA